MHRRERTGRERSPSDDPNVAISRILEEREGSDRALKVEKIDLLLSVNRENHETKYYEDEDLILRRGQKFELLIEFNRNVVQPDDTIILEFTFGNRPKTSKKTLVEIVLLGNQKYTLRNLSNTWRASDIKISGSAIHFGVTPPANTFIGEYGLYVKTKYGNEDTFKRNKSKAERIIVICNPWCQEDVVYTEDDKERQEYVLNEHGHVNRWPWSFGQFQKPCLEVALSLMDMYEMPDTGRANVVSILRCMSAMANSNDGTGVLTGRWTEPYSEGTKPLTWTGSHTILQKFHDTKKNVKFGQCWVFSGVLTTLCRALGIPTRSVTNVLSAHDRDMSMTIDYYFNSDGDSLEYLDDSVWNFHVWNEAWLRRNDLPKGYDGWQAFDSTPQESSEGIKRCGPAPVKAIKEGHVYLNYDVGFIFAEVNGDVMNWVCEDDGSIIPMASKEGDLEVGKKIFTHVNSEEVDLTHTYKYPEGSEDERRVTRSVSRYSSERVSDRYDLPPVELSFNTLFPEDASVGDDFNVDIIVKNESLHDRMVRLTATLFCAYYHGVAGKKIKIMKEEGLIQNNKDQIFVMQVKRDEYLKVMNLEGRFQLFICGKTLDNGRMNATKEDFVLKKPILTIEGPAVVPVGKDTEIAVKYKNTTSITQTHVQLHIVKVGVLGVKAETKTMKNLKPGDELSTKITVHPMEDFYFRQNLNVSLSSDEFAGVSAVHTFNATAEYRSRFS